ncbi:MAG: YigZ family protein [Streptococcaceae bacterium]|jgi:uncharacterized YigZ family protein|nr:YigZ family protein [Streptococcaceae bacterium]
MEEKLEYLTIKKDDIIEMEVKKSRFITHLKRVETQDEAKNFIQAIKKEHWKASHNCSAFILGQNMEIQRSSDDGEPSGTAGVPMLEVLKKNQLINVVAVVTRYYGGIKLGAGGLIRAYATSVSNAINEIGIVKGVKQQEIDLTISYNNIGKVQNFLLENPQYFTKDTVYAENVILTVFSDSNEVNMLEENLIDLLNGNIEITKKDFIWTEIPFK